MLKKLCMKIVSAALCILFIVPALCPVVSAAGEDTVNTELTGYISRNIDEVISKFKNMVNNHATTGISYQNSSVVFEAFDNKKICFVEINEACPYTLFGIGYGKDMSSAMDILTRKGWKLKQSNEIATASLQTLVDGTGNWVINLYSVGKKNVSRISIMYNGVPDSIPDNPFPPDTVQATDSPFRIVSDNPTLSIGVNEVFELGAGYRDGSKLSSSISFSVQDSSILTSGPVSAKEEYQYISLTAKKAGTCSVRVNDTKTGEFVDVPVTVTEPAKNAYTIYNVPTVSVDKTTANIYNINGITIDGFRQTTNGDGSCDMSFDAYNANWIYGIVEVYNADNSLRDCVLIDKGNRAAATDVKEAIWDNGKDLFSDIENGTLLSYKQASGYASKTPVGIKGVPKGGYIRITNSLKESGILSVVNLIDIGSDVLTTAKSAKDLHDALQKQKFMDAVTKATIGSSLFLDAGKSSQNLADKIAEKVMKTSITDKQSIGAFLDSVAATLSDMNVDEVMGEATVEEGISVAESNLLKFSGPAGAALGSMFTLDSMSNVVMESLSFCRSEFKNGVVIQVPDNNARSSDGVFVQLAKPIANNIALSVFKITYDTDAAARFFNSLQKGMPAKNQYFPDEYVNGNIPKAITDAKDAVFYNISFLMDGAAVQPGASATVSIPIPTEFAAEYGKFLKVYRVEPDGKLTDMNAAGHNGYLTFETAHFSYYMVTRENVKAGLPVLTIVVAAALAAVVGIIVLIFIRKRVRKKQQKC